MDQVETQVAFGRLPQIFEGVDQAGAGDVRSIGAAAWTRAVAVATGLDDIRTEIDANRELSDEGKRRKFARAVKDAGVELKKVGDLRDALSIKLAEAGKTWSPEPVSDEIAAAIWARLPDDAAKVRELYREAVQAGDSATAGSIEKMPVVHDGRLPNDELASLRRGRFATEAPELFQAFEIAETAHSAVDSALGAAVSIIQDHARDLPDPDDGDEAAIDDDGLRRLSISQFQEAVT